MFGVVNHGPRVTNHGPRLFSLPGDCIRIQISSGKDDPNPQFLAFNLAMKRGRRGNRAGRLDRASQMLGNQAHRVNDFFFRGQQDAVDAFPQNSERARYAERVARSPSAIVNFFRSPARSGRR